jgi:enamine deaminase RidA (YjgF/YER057c/UK114 family)
MTDTIEARLARLGVELPAASAPAANYLPFLRHGDLLFVSGQLPVTGNGLEQRGRLGESVSLEDGRTAARLCAINVLAQAKAALSGDLERIRQIVRITGYVASTPEFTDQHLVVNGASDLLAEALGERGKHSRAAVGVAALPLGAAVEVDAVIAVT